MPPLLILHVNYVEQGQSIEEMCAKAVEWGYDGIELRGRRPAVKETPEAYLDEIAAAAARAGLKHILFGFAGINLMLDGAAERRLEIDRQLSFFRLALERFPLTVFNAVCGTLLNPDKSVPYQEFTRHGSYIAEERHWVQATEGMRELGQFAEANGFLLAFETHHVYLHDTPAKTLELVKRIGSPAVGVNLDQGNAVYLPDCVPLAETIAALKGHLFYVHLKNSVGLGGKRTPVSMADGEINHREYLRLLKAAQFSGPICLEAPRPGDREWYARQDIAYIRSLLADLAWR